MSFLQRLKDEGVRNHDTALLSDSEEKVARLHVDLFKAEQMIVVYAQSAGADIKDVHVSIEGNADIILIEGTRIRPEHVVFPQNKIKGYFVAQECTWGDFYRRIVLPESVNIDKAEAKIKNGVLILILPLLKPNDNQKVKLKVSSGWVLNKTKPK